MASSTVESRPPLNATVTRGGKRGDAQASSTARNAAAKVSGSLRAAFGSRSLMCAGRSKDEALGSTLFEHPVAGKALAPLDEQGVERDGLQRRQRLRHGVLQRVGHGLRVAVCAAERLGNHLVDNA